MTQEKLPPHDNEAEEAVIGSLLVDGETIHDIPNLKPDDFFSERNKWIYEACLALYKRNEGINEVTVARELAHDEKLDKIGGGAYLAHIVGNCPTPYHAEYYGGIVSRLALHRRLISVGGEITRLGFNADADLQATLSKAEASLREVVDSQPQTALVTPEQAFTEASRLMDDLEEGKVTAIPTPFPTINFQAGGGLFGGELWYLGGRPGVGKTEIALQIARHIGQYGAVLYVSVEMRRRQLYYRHIAAKARIPIRSVRSGAYVELGKRNDIHDALSLFPKWNIAYLSRDKGLKITPSLIKSVAERMMNTTGLAAVIVDYVQRVRGEDRYKDIRERVSSISGDFQEHAQELNVPYFVLSQLNRATLDQEGKVPDLSNMAESGAIEQDADGVLLIHRPMVLGKYVSDAKLIFAKLRQGGGSGVIDLLWQNGEYKEKSDMPEPQVEQGELG